MVAEAEGIVEAMHVVVVWVQAWLIAGAAFRLLHLHFIYSLNQFYSFYMLLPWYSTQILCSSYIHNIRGKGASQEIEVLSPQVCQPVWHSKRPDVDGAPQLLMAVLMAVLHGHQPLFSVMHPFSVFVSLFLFFSGLHFLWSWNHALGLAWIPLEDGMGWAWPVASLLANRYEKFSLCILNDVLTAG